jgi:large subunit ribosomal protein L25
MNVVPLTVETGRETGTGNARRMRAQGQLPATVYGLGSEAVSVTVERSELRRALTTAAGANALLQLSYSGEQHYALVKEVQRHPVRREPIHIDFQRIDPEKPMDLDVPIVLEGEAKKVTTNGGMIEHVLQALRVSVRPDAIPNELVVDISNLEVDESITVADLNLPAGVSTEIDETTLVVTAGLTRAAIVELQGGDPDAEEGAEGGESAEGAESADSAEADDADA